MLPIQYDGELEYTEKEAPRHRPVRQGGGEEAQTAGGGGVSGEFGEGLTGLWGITGDSHLVQGPGTGYDGRGRHLAGGYGKINKG